MQSRVADTADVLATLLQSSPDAVIAVDADGLIVLASEAIRTLFGFEPDEVVGLPIETLVPEQVRALHERHRRKFAEIAKARPMGAGLELTAQRRDGSVFAIDVSLAPFSIDGERFVGAFVRDATGRRRQEARLQAVNEITQRLLAGEPTAATLELVACRARGLVDASLAWVVVPSGKEDLVVSASDGDGAAAIIGLEHRVGRQHREAGNDTGGVHHRRRPVDRDDRSERDEGARSRARLVLPARRRRPDPGRGRSSLVPTEHRALM